MKLVFGALLFLLTACQFQSLAPKSASQQGMIKQAMYQILPAAQPLGQAQTALGLSPLRPFYPPLEKPVIQAQAHLEGNTLTLNVKLPPLSERDFRTQLLDFSSASKVIATVLDSRGKVYYAVGSVANHVDYPVSGELNLSFVNILPDDLLFVSLRVRNASLADIAQADLQAVLKHTSSSTPISTPLNFQTTAVAKTMNILRATDISRARSLDLAALNTLVNSVTGISGTAPNYSYTTHPSLVLRDNLATDLVSSEPGGLTPANYRGVGGTVNLNVSGLLGSDKLQVQITDAASAVKPDLGNGPASVTGVTPGTVPVKITAFGSPSQNYLYTASPSNVTTPEGGAATVNITATPNVSVTGFSPAGGPAGTVVTLAGNAFLGTSAVRFNGVNASSFTVDSATQITATVPAGAGDGPITVVNGGSANSPTSFDFHRIIFVKTDASGSNNGTGWTDAYTSLQAALTAATAQDSLWIAAGTYTPGTLATDSFQMKANVNMYGGFNGTETLLSQRNPATHLTLFSGDLAGDDTGTGLAYAWVGTNSNNVIRGANNATLDGVTVRGGSGAFQGGGMLSIGVAPTLNQVIFEYNRATNNGGGMYVVGANAQLTAVTFRYNRQTVNGTEFGGAGLYLNVGANASLNNCVFQENSATDEGGGVFIYNASATFNGGNFSQNQAGSNGGAMASTNGSNVTANDAQFTANTSNGVGGAVVNRSGVTLHLNRVQLNQNTTTGNYGGGIYNTGIIHLSDVVLRQNSASGTIAYGGGMNSTGSSANSTLTRVAFVNNSVSGSSGRAGGGMQISGGAQASLNNVVFAGNSLTGSGNGGGLDLGFSTASLNQVTFANNTATTGSGLAVTSSTLTLRNGLFWNNTASGYTPLGSDGNLVASVDPFEDAANPLGADGLLNSNDGLRIHPEAAEVFGVGIDAGVTTDILGQARNGNPEPGAYEGPTPASPLLPANVVVVKANATGANNGRSWNDAFTNLKSAMDSITIPGKEIWVAQGTYTPGLPNTNSFQMRTGVSVYGGFAGTEYLRTARDPVAHPTILSGDLDGDDTGTGLAYAWVGTNSNNVIKGANNATLDGVTVRGGSGASQGGGMFNSGVAPSLNQVIFEYNRATNNGGGVFMSVSSSPVLSNLTFRYNRQTLTGTNFGGAGLFLSGGTNATLNNCVFQENVAAEAGGGALIMNASPTFNGGSFSQNQAAAGGGLQNKGSGTLTLNDLQFTANTSTFGGGGIRTESPATLHLNRVQINQNTTTAGNGGGIYNTGIIHLSDVVLRQNSAAGTIVRGGGMYSSGSSANSTLTRVAFVNNSVNGSSSRNAGGLDISGGAQASLNNVVFAGNSLTGSGNGGGLSLIAATASLNQVTFANNTATTGSGLFVSGGTVTLRNGLFWNNTASGYTPLGTDGNVTASVNPFEDTDNPLGADGLINANDGLRIKAGSSEVIDVGIDAGVATDILGLARNGNPEAGAYEYQP